jgi:hypothetical protein
VLAVRRLIRGTVMHADSIYRPRFCHIATSCLQRGISFIVNSAVRKCSLGRLPRNGAAQGPLWPVWQIVRGDGEMMSNGSPTVAPPSFPAHEKTRSGRSANAHAA